MPKSARSLQQNIYLFFSLLLTVSLRSIPLLRAASMCATPARLQEELTKGGKRMKKRQTQRAGVRWTSPLLMLSVFII